MSIENNQQIARNILAGPDELQVYLTFFGQYCLRPLLLSIASGDNLLGNDVSFRYPRTDPRIWPFTVPQMSYDELKRSKDDDDYCNPWYPLNFELLRVMLQHLRDTGGGSGPRNALAGKRMITREGLTMVEISVGPCKGQFSCPWAQTEEGTQYQPQRLERIGKTLGFVSPDPLVCGFNPNSQPKCILHHFFRNPPDGDYPLVPIAPQPSTDSVNAYNWVMLIMVLTNLKANTVAVNQNPHKNGLVRGKL